MTRAGAWGLIFCLGSAACSVDARDPGVGSVPVDTQGGVGSSGVTSAGMSPNGVASMASGSGGGPAPNLASANDAGTRPGPVGGSSAADAGAQPIAPATGGLGSEQVVLQFGNAEVRQSGATLEWRVTYAADATGDSGPLTLTKVGATDFEVAPGGCAASLAPGGSCTVDVSFNPQVAGALTGSLQLRAAEGASVSVALSGNSQVRVAVQRSGAAGSIGSIDPSGAAPVIDCGSRCSALFDLGAQLTLQAQTSNGSNTYFAGWSEPSCNGAYQRCTLSARDGLTITGQFSVMGNDLAFVSSAIYPPNLGSVARYDTACNELATAAGINTSTGDGFIAALGSSAASLRDRLLSGAPRGWLRMDGLPFTDDATALFDENRIFYPVRYNEQGGAAGPSLMLGSNTDGTTGPNCDDWTSSSADSVMSGGSSTAGPFMLWDGMVGNYCSMSWPLLCLGVTHSAPVTHPLSAGKAIWLTNTPHVVGSMTPDAHCQLERPTGVSSGVAFIAHTGRAAADVLDPAATYVRPDGLAVGTGADLGAGKLATGIWQLANGSYASGADGIEALTGTYAVTDVGTADTTCNDWSSSTGTSILGLFPETSVRFWFQTMSVCQETGYLYCVEP
jgi:hypothetical protein